MASRLLGPDGERGQVLPLFVIMTVVLLGGAALLTDVAWWWTNEQRMQRAADAGALAGAIYLPGNESMAFSTARAETAKNGYTDGLDGIAITPRRDPGDPRKLLVDVDGPVGTNFARVFCWDGGPCLDGVPVSVTGAASYVLPVPMGSPQNYYGVGYLVDSVATTTQASDSTGWNSPASVVSAGSWSRPWRAYSSGYTTETSDGDKQDWRRFRFLNEIANDASLVIDGLEVRLRFVAITGSGASSDCTVSTRVSWDGGANWSGPVPTSSLTTFNRDYYLGSNSSTSAWGVRAWTRSDFSDNGFRVRLAWNDGSPGCGANRGVRVGEIEARVSYTWQQTTTTIGAIDVTSPKGDVLAPQNFWGALQSQGAPNIQGDAYMTYYNTRTSTSNADYDSDAYYQYEVKFPAGSSSGEVWLFDPGFCEVGRARGTGESWTVGGSNGYSNRQPISTFYDLYDTRNTPYNTSDDIMVGSSGNAFRQLRLSDYSLGETAAADCSGLTWHNGWWRIARDLQGGSSYRLHTYSTDPSSPSGQRNSTALNAFAIWADANGGTPQVHGLGAMEAYVRLPGGRSSEFYLARIDAEHAGKTMVIRLWDPGDTGRLAANLQILRPTGSTYQTAAFSFTAERNSRNASDCNSRSGNGVTAVTTNSGGSSRFNGCWLNIEIPLPSDYTAPHPSSDTVTSEGGWWKIRYNMSGSPSDNSTDMTTWEVTLRGNPVHLVLQ